MNGAFDYHSLTLYFQDKPFLTLEIDPYFLMASRFSDQQRK